MVHKPRPTRSQNGYHGNGFSKPDDLESAITSTRRKPRFKDIVNIATHNTFHAELKRKLREEVDRDSLEQYRKPLNELKGIRNKKVRAFYEHQNELLNAWLEVDSVVMSMADGVLDSMNPQNLDGDGAAEVGGVLRSTGGDIGPLLPEDERERRRTGERRARWAININVIANVLLLAAKAFATLSSSSLSLIASLVDSALDLLCTLIIYATNSLVSWKLSRLARKFPVGRRRLEPIGILVFSIIMIISFLQILQESISRLLPASIIGPGRPKEVTALPPIAIAALAATVVVKGTIWIGCVRVKTTQVQALAQDCKTDVVFNTLSLLFPLLGGPSVLNLWWLDPLGASILSLFIIYDWASTMLENVIRLTGSAVDDHTLKKVMMMAYRFSPIVDGFKSVVAYHAGDGVWVEVDVMMGKEERLRRAHDVAETLQYCLEGLGEVDRAFVTIDYTDQGPTGHAQL